MSRKQRREAAKPAPKPKKKMAAAKSALLWAFEIVIVILCAYILAFFFGQSRIAIGQSMDVTISGGDKVLLDKLSYEFSSTKRGDIIAFKPGGSESSHSYIKRVIGLPGETIQIKDGMIYINGEIYLEQKDYPVINNPGLAEQPITLGTNEYFVLGDNRNNSEDSRHASVGNVRLGEIEGKVWMILSPKEHFGLVK